MSRFYWWHYFFGKTCVLLQLFTSDGVTGFIAIEEINKFVLSMMRSNTDLGLCQVIIEVEVDGLKILVIIYAKFIELFILIWYTVFLKGLIHV